MHIDPRLVLILVCTTALACGDSDVGDTPAISTTGAGSTTTPGGSTDGPLTTSGMPTTTPTTTGEVVPTTGSGESQTVTGQPSTGDLPGSTGPGETTDAPDTTGEMAQGLVRFVAIGDVGEGNANQYAVAQAIVDRCAELGCDFGVLLGDNFYDSGVDGIDDPQWQEKFELPYEDIDFPIYAALGNHDYGGNGLGVDFDTDKPQYQIDYTNHSRIWRMPAKYYSFSAEHADFWALDTNQVMTDPLNGDSDPQRDWLISDAAASLATWKIAFGHHPYISNGDHGNAGNYENVEDFPLPFVAGKKVKEFMDIAVCGKIDIYLAGHDHNVQWLEPQCGTHFIVSGAGAKSGPLPGVNPAYFAVAETEGFFWIELNNNEFTGVLFDKTGAELFRKTIVK